jgi:cubilin
MIGRFCGDTLPKGGNIITTHNQLYLWFRSDNSTAHEGFELSWESIDPGEHFPKSFKQKNIENFQ